MQEALCKYFALYHYISLPGIGRISSVTVNPVLDSHNNFIKPPGYTLALTKDTVTDNNLLNFLSKELDITEVVAEEQLQMYISPLQHNLQLTNKATIPGIATIDTDNNVYKATPAEVTSSCFPVLSVNPVIRNAGKHSSTINRQQMLSPHLKNKSSILHQKQKDYWWVAALIILVLTVGGSILFLLRDKLF